LPSLRNKEKKMDHQNVVVQYHEDGEISVSAVFACKGQPGEIVDALEDFSQECNEAADELYKLRVKRLTKIFEKE